MVKGVTYFNYTPETTIQIILGANGSGKSSLLKELSPLPALASEFDRGGYKKITISHKGSIYELTSDFTDKSNVYSFIKDSVELNPGYTITIYRDLVRTEFGYTQEIHDLLIGQTCFSSMDIATRRSWFTKLPSTDYSYAIRYFKKLSAELTGTNGAIKHVSGKLLQERSKDISEEEVLKLKEDIKVLKDYLAYILENKASAKSGTHEVQEEIKDISNNIEKLCKELKSSIRAYDYNKNILSIDDLKNRIISIQSDIASTTTLIEHIFKEAESVGLSIEELERNNAQSVEQLEKKMNERKAYVLQIAKSIKNNLQFKDPEKALKELEAVSIYLLEITGELESDPNKDINKEYYELLINKHSSLTKKLENIQDKLSHIRSDILKQEKARDHDLIECPNCTHKFSNSFSQSVYEECIKARSEAEKQAALLAQEIKDTEENRDRVIRRFELLRSFTQLTRGHPDLEPLWDYIRSNILFSNPSGCSQLLQVTRQDLIIQAEIERLTQDEKQEALLLQTMMNYKNSSLSDLKASYEKSSQEIARLQNTKESLKSELSYTQSMLSIAESIEYLKNELTKAIELKDSKINTLAVSIRSELQNKLIQNVQYEISIRESRLSSINNHASIIKDLDEQLAYLNNKKKILTAAVNILSPSEGLIAKGITGFINHFLSQMNSFIKNIWSYPFELVPLSPDENLDLDYKFPVKIANSVVSPDISKISKGQKEIVDLAFKVVACIYLHLDDAPLYLDEFGSSFDKEHRQAVSDMMHTLTHTSNFSQIYIISHYEEMYGSFKNTDITAFYDPQIESINDSTFNKVATFS